MYGDLTHGIYGGFNTTRDLENHRVYWYNATQYIYMSSNDTSIREWLSYGGLEYGVALGGLSHLRDYTGLGGIGWRTATK